MRKVLGLPTAKFRGFSYPEQARKPGKVHKVPIQSNKRWSASAESLGCGRTHFMSSLNPRKSEGEGKLKVSSEYQARCGVVFF